MKRRTIRRLYAISQARRRPLWRTIQYVLGPKDTRWRARRRVRPAE